MTQNTNPPIPEGPAHRFAKPPWRSFPQHPPGCPGRTRPSGRRPDPAPPTSPHPPLGRRRVMGRGRATGDRAIWCWPELGLCWRCWRSWVALRSVTPGTAPAPSRTSSARAAEVASSQASKVSRVRSQGKARGAKAKAPPARARAPQGKARAAPARTRARSPAKVRVRAPCQAKATSPAPAPAKPKPANQSAERAARRVEGGHPARGAPLTRQAARRRWISRCQSSPGWVGWTRGRRQRSTR